MPVRHGLNEVVDVCASPCHARDRPETGVDPRFGWESGIHGLRRQRLTGEFRPIGYRLGLRNRSKCANFGQKFAIVGVVTR